MRESGPRGPGSAEGAWTAWRKAEKLRGAMLCSKAGDGLGMVDGFGVAALGVGLGGEGEFGLEGEDVGGVALGVGGGLAGEGEHLGDVLHVLVTELLVLGAGAGVVVALGEAEAALIDGGDLLGGVLEVLLLAEAEEDVDVEALELADEGEEVGLGDVVDLVEEGLDGGEALLVDEGGVHAGGVVVADFLLVGSAGRVGRGVLGEDAVELLGVDVCEGVELVDAGLVGGNGMVLGEVAAGELVEVVAGVGGGVDGGGVEGGRGEVVGLGRSGGGLGLDREGGGEGEGQEGGAEGAVRAAEGAGGGRCDGSSRGLRWGGWRRLGVQVGCGVERCSRDTGARQRFLCQSTVRARRGEGSGGGGLVR